MPADTGQPLYRHFPKRGKRVPNCFSEALYTFRPFSAFMENSEFLTSTLNESIVKEFGRMVLDVLKDYVNQLKVEVKDETNLQNTA